MKTAQWNSSDKLNRHDLYPCQDQPAGYHGLSGSIAGMWTGERRAPRKGEWYISGAIPVCYRAHNDMPDSRAAIARLVCVERVTTNYVTPFSDQ